MKKYIKARIKIFSLTGSTDIIMIKKERKKNNNLIRLSISHVLSKKKNLLMYHFS